MSSFQNAVTNASSNSPSTSSSVFRLRNVRVYFYITTTMLIIWSFSFGATFDAYLLELARSRGRNNPNAFVGSVETVRGMVALLLAMPLGILADKVNRRKMLRASSLPGTLGVILLGVGIAWDSEVLIYCGVVICASFMQVFMSCGSAFLADCVPKEHLTSVMAMQSSLYLIGYSVGPLAQVVIIASVGNTWNLSELHIFLCAGFAFWPLVLPAFFLFERTPAEDELELQRSLNRRGNGSEAAPLNPAAEEGSWKTQRLLGVRKKWLVPIVIEFCSLITATGAGMTVKFFPLFFKEDYHFKPIALNGLSAGYTISIAIFVQICRKVSSHLGRCQAAFIWQVAGILSLLGLWTAQPLALVIVLYIIRGSFMNACGPINSALIMDCVDSKFRGRWSAIQSISRFSWSGSAVLGGWLADGHDYRFTFLITAIIYSVASVLYMPLLCVVPHEKNARSPTLASSSNATENADEVPAENKKPSSEEDGIHNASVISMQPIVNADEGENAAGA